MLQVTGVWENVNHRWKIIEKVKDTAAASPRRKPSQAKSRVSCEPYCTEPCANLNGDVAVECGTCVGEEFLCHPGGDGFPSEHTEGELPLAGAVQRKADICHGVPHALRWLLGRLLSPEPALRGPPALLLAALERLRRLDVDGLGGDEVTEGGAPKDEL